MVRLTVSKISDPSKNHEGSATRNFQIAQSLCHPPAIMLRWKRKDRSTNLMAASETFSNESTAEALLGVPARTQAGDASSVAPWPDDQDFRQVPEGGQVLRWQLD